MKPSDIENLGADQRYGVYMAAGAVKGIGKILFSHSDGSIAGMRSNEVDTLYMGLIALGQFMGFEVQRYENVR